MYEIEWYFRDYKVYRRYLGRTRAWIEWTSGDIKGENIKENKLNFDYYYFFYINFD